MQIKQDREHINTLIDSAKNIAVISGRHGTDGVGAAIAMAEYISEKFNKKAEVIYPFDKSEFNQELLMIRNVSDSFGSTVLKMTLDYSGTDISTVDYSKEGDSKLVLEIKPVNRDFDMKRISYDFKGSSFDLIITVGVEKLDNLGQIYSANKEVFDSAAIINIDNSVNNENYGKINIVNTAAANLSTLILAKFAEWEYTATKQTAKSLLIGLNG